MKRLLIIFALFGFAISYKSIYAFHLVLLVWLLVSMLKVISGEKVHIKNMNLYFFALLFFAFSILSAIWHPDLNVLLRYLLYFGFGFAIMFATTQFADSATRILDLYKIIVGVFLISITIGLLESLGIFRYPLSPYSSYASFFGYKSIDISMVGDAAWSIIKHKPTGLSSNPNNFGFLLLLSTPFVVLFPKRRYAVILGCIILWLVIAIGSKGLFLSLLLIPVFWFLTQRVTINHVIAGILIFFVSLLILLLPVIFDLSFIPGVNRMYSSFHEVMRGLELMSSDASFAGDSTSARAALYINGVIWLVESYGLGLGLGGIEALLQHQGSIVQSFHFFFLQMLIELGIFFVIFMYAYFWLINGLLSTAKKMDDQFTKYLLNSCGLALLLAIPGSISPSSLHYELPFYVLIGFSLATLSVFKLNTSEAERGDQI